MPIIDNLISSHASKIGFLFISFMVVASGYVNDKEIVGVGNVPAEDFHPKEKVVQKKKIYMKFGQ